jgi:NADPH:quinone reductase-like Zn-dependent oxidoreductase
MLLRLARRRADEIRAIVRDGYGSSEVLRLEDVATPEPAADEVLVRVVAAAVNRADLDNLKGWPTFARVATGLRGPRNRRLGSDVAGVVEAVGPAASRFRPGDEVFGDLTLHGSGAFAEAVCAPEKAFAPKPAHLSQHEAAALAWGGILALQALRAKRPLESGERVLVNGASGTVGPFAIQIAKAWGADVTAVASAEKLDFVRSLGADHVVDYRTIDVAKAGRTYDRMVDVAARHSILTYRRILRRRGVYAWIGGSLGSFFATMALGHAVTLATGRDVRPWLGWRPFRDEDVATLVGLVEAGQVRPVIDRTFPLTEAGEALRYVDEGRARGKVVLTV